MAKKVLFDHWDEALGGGAGSLAGEFIGRVSIGDKRKNREGIALSLVKDNSSRRTQERWTWKSIGVLIFRGNGTIVGRGLRKGCLKKNYT